MGSAGDSSEERVWMGRENRNISLGLAEPDLLAAGLGCAVQRETTGWGEQHLLLAGQLQGLQSPVWDRDWQTGEDCLGWSGEWRFYQVRKGLREVLFAKNQVLSQDR